MTQVERIVNLTAAIETDGHVRRKACTAETPITSLGNDEDIFIDGSNFGCFGIFERCAG